MKHLLYCILLLSGNFIARSQLSYNDFADLNKLCKKEDFEAAKTFLTNKGYTIYSDKGSYDHGSYFVLAEIEAKKKIGNRNDFLLKGTDYDNMYDEISINYKEYDDYKELELEQKISTNQTLSFVIKTIKNQAINSFKYDNWTMVLWMYKFQLGSRNADASTNYILPKIEGEKLRKTFSDYAVDENEDLNLDFFNDNEKYGDLKWVSIYYNHKQSRDKNFDPYLKADSVTTHFYNFTLSIETKFAKGKNVNSSSNTISIPLIKKGNHYYVKIKFGNLIKTYLLDSGASDMSIDDETFKYLQKTNQLTTQNRLSIGKYQLADGSIVELKRIRIPSFVIDKIEVNDIDATIVQNGKPLLLGKSFLDSFKSWKIDNKSQTLIVELFQ